MGQLADTQEDHATPPSKRHLDHVQLDDVTAGPSRASPGSEKRRRVMADDSPLYPSQGSSMTSAVDRTAIPHHVLLYHLAQVAHQASHRHLQQAFVPSWVSTEVDAAHLPISIIREDGTKGPFSHDAAAANKSLGLLLHALDLLRLGLRMKDLSDRDRVLFGVEYALIGVKVLAACQVSVKDRKGKSPASLLHMVDCKKLAEDVGTYIGQSISLAERNTHLIQQLSKLNWLDAKVAFLVGQSNTGRRMIAQALKRCNPDDHGGRYALCFLLAENCESGAFENAFTALEQIERESQTHGHAQVTDLARIAKVRLAFVQRKWDHVESAMGMLSAALQRPGSAEHSSSPWRTYVESQYLHLRALWEGRQGNDDVVKAILKQLYGFVDDANEMGAFDEIRELGGVIPITIPGSQAIYVEVTPPNRLLLSTYLVSIISRRSYSGPIATCKTIAHATAMRVTENIAVADDMWDTGFNPLQGPQESLAFRRHVVLLRAEILLELASAMVYRSEFEGLNELLAEIIDLARKTNTFDLIAPQLGLVHAQYAHATGMSSQALRYYRFCDLLLLPGSELGLAAEIGRLGAIGYFQDLVENPAAIAETLRISRQCRGSSSAAMHAVGHLLASLATENNIIAKKHLSTAYDIAQRSNNNVIRCLIFAFTTSFQHYYGGNERILRQLETGRDIASLLGGQDREDKVGQIPLGMWFAVKLQSHFRQNGDKESERRARESIDAHHRRLQEVCQQSARGFGQL